MSKFAIVGIQRSGTTLVRSTLSSHPEILCLGEVFYINRNLRRASRISRGETLSRNFSDWRKFSYQAYLEQSVGRRIGHWLWRGRMMRDYLNGIYDLPGYPAIGFKLMLSQLRTFPDVVPYLIENHVRIIHVLRANVFKVYLSRLAMDLRGYAHSAQQPGKLSVFVPTSDLLNRLGEISDHNKRWEGLFANYRNYLRVSYESFSEDRTTELGRILSFVGVDTHVALESELVRLSTAPLHEIVENYGEVQACLSGSEFSWCLT